MSEWIKCSERLPEAGVNALWYIPECNWYQETYRIMTARAAEGSARKPTHWQSLLPPAPEEE